MFVALLNVGVSQMFLLWFENYAAKTPPGLKVIKILRRVLRFMALLNVGVPQMVLLWFENSTA